MDRAVIAFVATDGVVDIECLATDDDGSNVMVGDEWMTRSERWPIRSPPPPSIFTHTRPHTDKQKDDT